MISVGPSRPTSGLLQPLNSHALSNWTVQGRVLMHSRYQEISIAVVLSENALGWLWKMDSISVTMKSTGRRISRGKAPDQLS